MWKLINYCYGLRVQGSGPAGLFTIEDLKNNIEYLI